MDPMQTIENWVRAYVDRLTHIAYTYVRDWSLAEDVAQEAFLKAHRSMNQLKDPQNPLPWLIRIVINECRNRHRRTWREILTSILPEYGSKSAEDSYFELERIDTIHIAVLALPEMYRTPIVLFYFEDLSTQEIAEVLHTHPGTVRTRLTRGRNQLQKMLRGGELNEIGGATSKCKSTI